jgi:hypothetical protein
MDGQVRRARAWRRHLQHLAAAHEADSCGQAVGQTCAAKAVATLPGHEQQQPENTFAFVGLTKAGQAHIPMHAATFR